jgi:hypothetical protein
MDELRIWKVELTVNKFIDEIRNTKKQWQMSGSIVPLDIPGLTC